MGQPTNATVKTGASTLLLECTEQEVAGGDRHEQHQRLPEQLAHNKQIAVPAADYIIHRLISQVYLVQVGTEYRMLHI